MGDTGEYVVSPEQSQIDHAIAERQRQRELREQAEQHCLEPAMTLDQHQVEIAANIGQSGRYDTGCGRWGRSNWFATHRIGLYVTQQCA